MARKNAAAVADETIVRAPDGFRDLDSLSAECWFGLETGNVLQGLFLGMHTMDDPRAKVPGTKKKFFQVQVTKPGTKGRYGKGEEVTAKEIPVGAIINLNYSTKTSVLEKLLPGLENNGKYEVWVDCGKKIPVGKSGNKMWAITCKSKTLLAPSAPQADFSDTIDVPATGADESEAETEQE